MIKYVYMTKEQYRAYKRYNDSINCTTHNNAGNININYKTGRNKPNKVKKLE